jgi:hypothetical protein
VKLTAGGRDHTQPLVVLKDPNSAGTEADIAAQFTLMREVRGSLEMVATMINEVELVRKQLQELSAAKSGQPSPEVRAASAALEAKLVAFEGYLHQMKYTGTGQDSTRWPSMLVEKLMHLAADLEIADFPPTDQQREVHRMFTTQIAEHRARQRMLFGNDVAAFNDLLQAQKLPRLFVPGIATPQGGRADTGKF